MLAYQQLRGPHPHHRVAALAWGGFLGGWVSEASWAAVRFSSSVASSPASRISCSPACKRASARRPVRGAAQLLAL